ncbi:hypothetical protein Tco_0245232, partial [Tanacetum coccineum]
FYSGTTSVVAVFSVEGTSWDTTVRAWSSVSPLLVIIRGGFSLEKSSGDFYITEGVSEEVNIATRSSISIT